MPERQGFRKTPCSLELLHFRARLFLPREGKSAGFLLERIAREATFRNNLFNCEDDLPFAAAPRKLQSQAEQQLLSSGAWLLGLCKKTKKIP